MVTIIDVANYAGVSKTTVSAVLNNGPHVKEETRRQIFENTGQEDNCKENHQKGRTEKAARAGRIHLPQEIHR